MAMSESNPKIAVMIVEDHQVVREGLTILIEQNRDMAVCAGVGTAEEAMAALARTRPDVIILDLALGRATGKTDFDFHRAIAKATNNPFYVEVLDALGSRTIPCDVTSPWGTESFLTAEYQAGLQREHHAILRAISAGDADAARAAMRRHLMASQQRYRDRLAGQDMPARGASKKSA